MAQRFLLIGQPKGGLLVLGKSIGGSGSKRIALLQGKCRVGQLERLSDGLDDRGEYSLGGKRRLQALTQAREDGIRVVPLAIHQAIDNPLEPGAQRLKEYRAEAR